MLHTLGGLDEFFVEGSARRQARGVRRFGFRRFRRRAEPPEQPGDDTDVLIGVVGAPFLLLRRAPFHLLRLRLHRGTSQKPDELADQAVPPPLQRRPQHLTRRLRPDVRAHELIHDEQVTGGGPELPGRERVRLEQRRIARVFEQRRPLPRIRLSRHGYHDIRVLWKFSTQPDRVRERPLRLLRRVRVILIRDGVGTRVAVQRREEEPLERVRERRLSRRGSRRADGRARLAQPQQVSQDAGQYGLHLGRGFEARLVGAARERQTLRGSDDERGAVAEANPERVRLLVEFQLRVGECDGIAPAAVRGRGERGHASDGHVPHARALATVRPPGPPHVRVAVWREGAAARDPEPLHAIRQNTLRRPPLALVRAEIDQREGAALAEHHEMRRDGRWRRRWIPGAEAECAGSRRAPVPGTRRIRRARRRRRQEGELLDRVSDGVRVMPQGDASHGSNPRGSAAAGYIGHLATSEGNLEDDDVEVARVCQSRHEEEPAQRAHRDGLRREFVLQQHRCHAEVVPGVHAEDVPLRLGVL